MEKKAKPVMKSDVFKVKLEENKFAFSLKGNITKIQFTETDNLLKKDIIKEITNLVNEISSSEETVKKLSNNLKIKVNITEKDGVKTLASEEIIVKFSSNGVSHWKSISIDRISNNAKFGGTEESCGYLRTETTWGGYPYHQKLKVSKELNELSTYRLLKILQKLEKNIK